MNSNNSTKGSLTRSRPSCCIFVASLSLKLNDKILLETVKENFKKFGEIKLIKVLRDAKNRPYAFVQYFNTEDANTAVQNSKGAILNNRPCRVEKAKVNRTLFLKQLNTAPSPYYSDKHANIKTLIEDFIKHGEIEQIVSTDNFISLVKDNKIEQPKNHVKELIKENVDIFQTSPLGAINDNCWFLQFAFREDAITAHALYQNIKNDYLVHWAENIVLSKGLEQEYNLIHKFEGLISTFETKHAPSTHLLAKNTNINLEIDVHSIFVGQLTQACTQDMLYDKFSKHGVITNLKLFTKNPNNCYAFITFEDNRSAGSAIETENHTYFNNKSIHVQYRELQHDNAETKKTNSKSFYKNNYNDNGRSCTQQKNFERNGYPQRNSFSYPPNSRSNTSTLMNERLNKSYSNGSNYTPPQTAYYDYNNEQSMPMMYNYSHPSSDSFMSLNDMSRSTQPNLLYQNSSKSNTVSSLGSIYSSSSTPNSIMSNNGMYNNSNSSVYSSTSFVPNNMEYANVYNGEKPGILKNMANTLYNDNNQTMYPNYYPQ